MYSLDTFYFHLYRIQYRATRKAWLVPESQAQAALLRGAIYNAITENHCLENREGVTAGHRCGDCHCIYTRLLEPYFPEGYPDARKYAPHVAPYVIYSNVRHGIWESGETWTWQLTLFGNVNDYMPELVQVLQKAATIMGERQGSWELAAIQEISPYTLRDLASPISSHLILPEVQDANPISTPNQWSKGQASPFEPRLPIRYSHFQPVDTDTLWLTLMTPLEMYQHKNLNFQPEPLLFLTRLCERISVLNHLFCQGDWALKIQPHAAVADWKAQYNTTETEWRKAFTRQKQIDSSHSGNHYQVKGSKGSMIWKGKDIGLTYPLLQMGQYIHVGKKTIFGQGKYSVEI